MTPSALVLAAAALTYASRAAALTLLPPPSGRLQATIERVPAPLFAGLAVLTLLGQDLRIPPTSLLLAATAALALTPTRSLLAVLAAGLAAYTTAVWLL